MIIEKNKDLTKYNTFKIKEFCDEFIEIEQTEELENINFSDDFLILGEGSNVLLSRRIKQVIHLNTKGIKVISEDDEFVTLKVQAGENWEHLVNFSIEKNYCGAENLSLIPGDVGAAPVQNIGAYGVEAKDIITKVEFFNIETRKFSSLENKECYFEYRSSIFKHELKGKVIITAVYLKLSKKNNVQLNYGGLKKYFRGKSNVTASDVRDAVIAIRETKIPDPDIIGNAGSFFKNAIVKEQKICELSAKYNDLPFFRVSGGFKIPTAWLIEKAGFKGFRNSDAAVYDNHALILINLGSATAQEVLELAKKIEDKILKIFGIKIYKEVNVI